MPNPRRTKIKNNKNKKNTGVALPKKTSSATKAAQTIKKETINKTTSKKSYTANSNNNIGRTGGKDYSKEYSTAKTKASNYAKKIGNTIKKEWNIDKVKKNDRNVNRISSNRHGLTDEAKDIQNRALSGALEANNAFDKVFNPMGKFISNAMDSTIDNSLLGAGYTLATGKRLSSDAYYNNPYEEQRRQGISAGAGRMAGMALNYGLMRSAFNPQLEQAANAVMNGTKLGNAIKGSSILGKIGQSTGNKIAQDIGKGLVKETISDATLGFGQNALINYGEGLRGEDFWKQQAKDTALDFLVGGVMEGAGIGSQIRGIGREARAITNQGVADTLANSTTRKEYLDSLIERVKGFDENRFGERSDIPKIREASENKVKELMDEYAKASRMSNKKYRGYREGEFVIDSNTRRPELFEEALRRGLDVDDKTTVAELKRLLKGEEPSFEEELNKMISPETVTVEEPKPVAKAEPKTAEASAPSSKIEPEKAEEPKPVKAEEPKPAKTETKSTAQKESKKNLETANDKNKKRYRDKLTAQASDEELQALDELVEKKKWSDANELVEKINKRNGNAPSENKPAKTVSDNSTHKKGEEPVASSNTEKGLPNDYEYSVSQQEASANIESEPEKLRGLQRLFKKEPVAESAPVKATAETPAEKPVESVGKSVSEEQPKAETNNTQTAKDDETAMYEALYNKLHNEGEIHKFEIQRQDLARERREEFIREEIEKEFSKKASEEEREELFEYASKNKWKQYDELYDKLKKRRDKTDKSHNSEVVAKTQANPEHRKVTEANKEEIEISNLKGIYPNANDDDAKQLLKLRNAGDTDGFNKLVSEIDDRAMLRKIKESYEGASEEEIERLFNYQKNGNDKEYEKLSNEIRKRSEKETKEVIKQRDSAKEKQAEELKEINTEREALIEDLKNQKKKTKDQKKKAELQERIDELELQGEAGYLVKKYNLDTGIDESTTRALATSYDIKDYTDYLDYRISRGGNDSLIEKLQAEKRRVKPITEEQFNQYKVGKFTPPDVAETEQAKRFAENYTRDDTLNELANKGREQLNKRGKNSKHITEQEAQVNQYLKKAEDARSPKMTKFWKDKAQEIREKSPKEYNLWKAEEKAKEAEKLANRKVGIGDLSIKKAKEKGLKFETIKVKTASGKTVKKIKPWEIKKMNQLKSYKGQIKSIDDAMTYMREIVDDFMDNALTKPLKDTYKIDEPLTIRLIASAAKKSETRIRSLIKGDISKMTPEQIAQMIGADVNEFKRNLGRLQTRHVVVNPDRCTVYDLSKVLGIDPDELRLYIKYAEDLYIEEETSNVLKFAGKKPEMKDGLREALQKLGKEKKGIVEKTEGALRVRKELDRIYKAVDEHQAKGEPLSLEKLAEESGLKEYELPIYMKYTELYEDANGNVRRHLIEPEDYSKFSDEELDEVMTGDIDAIMRELNKSRYGEDVEGLFTEAPAQAKAEVEQPVVQAETPKAEVETPKTEVETPKAEPQKAEAEPKTVEAEAPRIEAEPSKEYPIDNSYTRNELAEICKQNGLPYKDAEGHKFKKPKLQEILKQNEITTANFESSGKGLETRHFASETAKTNGELPKGEKVEVRTTAEVKPQSELPKAEAKAENELPTARQRRAEKDRIEFEEAKAEKRDWKTLSVDAKRKYASEVVGVKGAYKMNGKQLDKAIQDILDGKVKSKFAKITVEDVANKYLKMRDDYLAKGVDIEKAIKDTDITAEEFIEYVESKGYRVDRDEMKVYFKEPPKEPEVIVSKIAPDETTTIEPEKNIVSEKKRATKSDLSQNEEDWLNNNPNSIKNAINEWRKVSAFNETMWNNKGYSLEDLQAAVKYKGSEKSFVRILEASGYEVKDFAKKGELKNVRVVPYTQTSMVDSAPYNLGGGTYTINPDSSSLPKGKKVSSWDSTTEDYRTSRYTNTASNNANPSQGGNRGKTITEKTTYKDIVERYKGMNERNVLEEIEEAYKRWKGTDTTKTLESYLNSPDISPETKRILIQQRDNNQAFVKSVVTDDKVAKQAEENLNNDFAGTVAALKRKLNNGEQFTKQDEADLFHAVMRYDSNGEFSKSAELLAMSDDPVGEAGRVLAYRRWLHRATPEGRVYSAVSTLKKIAKANGTKFDNLKINYGLLDAIHDAKTEKELSQALNAWRLDIWNQIPPSFVEKANAWRYLAMLGNPKTHIRNILGNTLFLPARVISDSIATGLEKGFSKRIKSVGGDFGTHAILNRANAGDRELLKLGTESFKQNREAISASSAKFFESMRHPDSAVFSGKFLDKLARGNTKLLDLEDAFGMGITYRSAYAQYLKAHGIKASDVTEEIAKKASKYAENEALKAVYRDANQLATSLNKFRRNLKPTSKDTGLMAAGKTATGFLMDSTIPFVKTPLNILKRGTMEYSPIGLARGLLDIRKAKNSKQLLDGIEYLANGLTGSGVLALGLYLGHKGIVNGSLGKYDKNVAYDKMLGQQDYAVNIGDKSITLDWIAPMSMPFFVGVEAGTNLAGEGDVFTWMDALSKMTNPVFEMSMLQGIENTFNTAMNEDGGLGTIAKNAGFNYISQYVPTLFGQATRTFVNKNRKTTLSTSTNPFQKEMEKQLGKIINKTPLSNALSQDYVDQWGRTEPNNNLGMSFLENFLSPAYISQKNETTVDKELKDLYTKLGEENKNNIIPTVNSSAFKQDFDGKEYVMTPAEFTQYKKTVGQAKYNGLEELFKTNAYKNASIEEKRKMIENVYDEANLEGKKEYLTKASPEYASAPDFYALDSNQREKYDETLDISKEKWAKAYNSMAKVYDTVKRDSGEVLSTDDKAFVLASSGIKTLEQAQSFNKNISQKSWNLALQQVKNGKTIDQMMKDVEARKNMTDSEKEFAKHYQTRAETRYVGSATKDVPKKLYDAFIKESQLVDKNSNDNGTITQAEATETIERLDRKYGLSNAQKACLWYLAQNDEGWAKKPYGNYKP